MGLAPTRLPCSQTMAMVRRGRKRGVATSTRLAARTEAYAMFALPMTLPVVFPIVLPVIPFPAINPILISIGPLAIRWYALAYIVGIIAGWFYARAIIASERLWGGPAPMRLIDFDDFVIWITLGIILGGRTGYVLFYNFPHFAAHPLEIFQLWNGGMSFHGGVTGCIVAIVAFALLRRIPMLPLADVTAAVAPIGLFLGRLANFINGELWGRPTDVPWAMIFPNGGPIPRHPSQLYEAALEGIVLFVVLGMLVRMGALKRPGVVTGCFAIGYGVARITCELFREPDVQLGFLWGGLTMGMVLSVPLMLAGAVVLAFALTREPKPKDV
jgi:phosphatidylglycerol---prolipoprotein diacylglyceryl transferase